jgi:hypothetical protein
MANWIDLNLGKTPVELTESKVIEALKSAVEKRHQKRQSRQVKVRDARVERRKRCECGSCTVCMENARWEAIFNAKFADPDYYKSRPIRGGSSLDWMRPAARQNPGRQAER